MGLGQVQIQFDSAVYRLEAIKKAAYRLGAEFSFDIKSVPESSVEVIVTYSPDQYQAEDVFRRVKREVLDQELRESIHDETATVRNLLLAHAFSETGLASDGNRESQA